MSAVALPALVDDHLSVLTFGTGIGELILVRAPPDTWMVVDGCGVGEVDYAARALAHYRARPSLIVLTHPHDDHSRGVADLIREATPAGRQHDWPRIGMVLPPGPDVRGQSEGLISRITLDAIGVIEDRWNGAPSCRWDMNAGETEPLGDATVRALSPDPVVRARQLDRWEAGKKFDNNVISSALLVVWRGRRVLLGSDLVEQPGAGWTASLRLDPELADHDLLKGPHHGSDKALHDDVLRPGARVRIR